VKSCAGVIAPTEKIDSAAAEAITVDRHIRQVLVFELKQRNMSAVRKNSSYLAQTLLSESCRKSISFSLIAHFH
jgi:hypothetical protein